MMVGPTKYARIRSSKTIRTISEIKIARLVSEADDGRPISPPFEVELWGRSVPLTSISRPVRLQGGFNKDDEKSGAFEEALNEAKSAECGLASKFGWSARGSDFILAWSLGIVSKWSKLAQEGVSNECVMGRNYEFGGLRFVTSPIETASPVWLSREIFELWLCAKESRFEDFAKNLILSSK
jgi:hypothetical protein